jgi:hypothetical protein
MPNHRRQDRELDALYQTLPHLECQGFCHDSCGPIEMSVREQARIIERARKPITCNKGASCSMLTEDRRCSVYDIRPIICRLWGLVRSMPCPYGCRPEGGLLSDAEGARLIAEADRIGGHPAGDRTARMIEKMLDVLNDEEIERIASPVMRQGRATVSGRLATLHRTGVRSPIELPGIPVGETGMAYPKSVNAGDGERKPGDEEHEVQEPAEG